MIKQGVLATTVVALCSCTVNPVLVTIDEQCDYTTVKTIHGHQDRKMCSSVRIIDDTHSAKELDEVMQKRGVDE